MREDMFNGEVLRQRRLDMGLTREEVFQKVRVPIQYLVDLEEGNVEALPPACYTVGFLKSYCAFLGIPADPMVASYRAVVEPPPRTFFLNTGEFYDRLANRRVSNVMTWAAVCAVLAAGWLAYATLFKPQPEENRVEAVEKQLVVPPPIEPPSTDFGDW